MKTLHKSKLVLKMMHRIVMQIGVIVKCLYENISIREWLALLILVPFSLGYLGLLIKALFVISTSEELSQIAQSLLFPLPFITILTLILGYYFKRPKKDDGDENHSS